MELAFYKSFSEFPADFIFDGNNEKDINIEQAFSMCSFKGVYSSGRGEALAFNV